MPTIYEPINVDQSRLWLGVVSTGTMTSGSNALHDTGGRFNFTSADVGQPVWIIGAQTPIGADATNGMLRATIATVVDSTHATTDAPATTTVDPGLASNVTLFRLRGLPLVASANIQTSLTTHDTMTFSFMDTLPKPEVRQPVLFAIQGNAEFGGTIDNIVGQNVPGSDLGSWQCDAVGWDKTSYKRTTGEISVCSGSPAFCNPDTGTFTNKTVADIMHDLVVHTLSDEGLDFEPNVTGPVIPTFTVSYAAVGDAFDQLMTAGSDNTTFLHWHTDPLKVILLDDQASINAPWNIDDTDPDQKTILADVQCTWDRSQYINRAIVRVSNEVSAPLTESFTMDGHTTSVNLGYPAATAPTITEDGVEVSVGVQGINTGCAWYWNLNSTQITADPSSAPLAFGVILAVTLSEFIPGFEQYQFDASVDESTAIESGTGRYESVIQQDNPATQTDAITLAAATAHQFGEIPRTLQINTYRPGLKIGQNITVTLSKFGLSAVPMCVQTVQITTDENILLWTVTMVGSPLINSDYRATLATLRPGAGGGAGGGSGGGIAPGPQMYWRTVDINDTTVGTNIAPNLSVQGTGQGIKITGILRKVITADLVVQVNVNSLVLGTLTIPAATAVKTEVSTPIVNQKLVIGMPMTFDITGSDGSKDKNGIATVTVEWGVSGQQTTITGQWKGPWSSGATYAMGDSVFYSGSSYISLQDVNLNHQPDTSPSWWDLLAEEGADGAAGQGVPTGGTAGQVLTKNSSTDFDDSWASPLSLTPLTTKGDLMTFGPVGSPAVGTPVRLGVGGDGYILTADSSQPYGIKWNNFSGAAAYISTLIAGPDTSKTITGFAHGYATAALMVQVYDGLSPRTAVECGWTVDAVTFDVVVTFAAAQSNYYVVINGAVGATGPAGPTGPAGGGTVTSVALSMPAEFSVGGSPITTSGTLAVTKATQSANTVFAGPTTGSAAAPTFRAVVPADLPLGSSSAFGAVKVDNTTITASAGVISAVGGGGSGTVTNTGTLTANLPVFGNGGVDVIIGSRSGNTTEVATVSGSLTSGNVTKSDASGNIVDGGFAPYANPVIGTANFNGNGSISNTHYGGVISSVTFVSTGKYTVNLSATVADFSIAIMCSDDNTTAMTSYLSGSPDLHAGVSSFTFFTFATDGPGAPAQRSSQSITVMMVKL